MALARGAAIAFTVALAARAALLLASGDDPGRPLEGDERGYAAVAGSLARGDGPGFTVEGRLASGLLVEKRMEAFRAPLLPAVLTPVHAAADGSPAALRWACAVLGALAAPLGFAVASRLGGARAGWIAGIAIALWPSHAWLSARVLSEPLDALLLLAGADLISRHRPAAGGAVLGLAVLCRPGGLLPAVLAVAAAASAEESGRRLRPLVLGLAALAAVVLPWVLRNSSVVGAPVLATTSGVTLLGGNCDAALAAEAPGKWVPPERAWRGPGGPDMGMYGWSDLGEAASSERFATRAREWVAAHPADAARLAGWKAVRFLDPDTRSEKDDAWLKAMLGWASWTPLLLAVVLALSQAARRGEPEVRAAAALLLGHLAVALVAYGDARMRAPVEPALIALLAAPWLAGARIGAAPRSPGTLLS
ncbi:MAG TPA: hypothetical protein VFS92_11300 [Planctomycetota bacterium]|nr:hypothetical protein [Planctomycetota bacterium]